MAVIDPTTITTIGSTAQSVVAQISYFVGGIFGIYLILLFLRWWEYRTLSKFLLDIKRELAHLNHNLGHGSVEPESGFFTQQLYNLSSKIYSTPPTEEKKTPKKKKKISKKKK